MSIHRRCALIAIAMVVQQCFASGLRLSGYRQEEGERAKRGWRIGAGAGNPAGDSTAYECNTNR
jgi:hypothetical protein